MIGRPHLRHPTIWTVSLLLFFVGVLLFSARPAFADTAYNGGELIDDPIFLNAASMGTGPAGIANIQSFLTSKGSFLASYSSLFDCSLQILSNQQTINAYTQAGAPCGQNASAATMIYYASQVYGMNPQAVLATMQKEQGIVTSPTYDSYKINYAMGFGCPDSGGCSATPNSNLIYQIDNGTGWLRINYERARGNMTYWFTSSSWVCGSAHTYYRPNLYPNQNVSFGDDNGTTYATYYISNPATSSLYCYTPHAYNNPQGLYGLPQFGTTGLYYTGSYNFVKYFDLWFGTTYAFMSNGVSFTSVFDPTYYLANNPDVQATYGDNQLAAFGHFLQHGMAEGRVASPNFNVTSYRNRYPDLRWAFGTNLPAYYMHYITTGKNEGRVATGVVTLQPVTVINGVDYSSVYDFNTYLANNQDVASSYANNDTGALWHFVTYGMAEGRVASPNFNVTSYRNRYPDLRWAFGTNLPAYYMHYITTGKNEGRVATGTYVGGTTVFNGVDYSAVYNLNDYETYNADVQKAFGLDDYAALQHFLQHGMSEGRQASTSFNVYYYKANNLDLQQAFGNNLSLYYLHYIQHGKAEGRKGAA